MGILRRLGLSLLVFCGINLAAAESVIPLGAPWRYFEGTSNPAPAEPSAWRYPDFNDSAWLTGGQPMFYGENLNGTRLDNMTGRYSSVYFRHTFTVSDPADVTALNLMVQADDGFVAWINGQEVARFNVPGGDLQHHATAGPPVSEPVRNDAFPVANPAAILRPGLNVVAIHGFNSSLMGDDFVVHATLEATVDRNPPVIDRVVPDPSEPVAELHSLEIQFSRPVKGVDAADLLVNGAAATDSFEVTPGQFLFTFAQPPAGTVVVRFRENHGISDQAATPREFAGAQWTFTIDPAAPNSRVVINEFMADNERTLRDEDGDASDWIELFNAGEQPVSLLGWFLTDDASRRRKWRFPPVTLGAKEFLVLFASGENRTNDPAILHTNFRLSKEQGYLALSNPAGEVVSVVANYPGQRSDVSYGLPMGSDQLGFFVEPTPGKPNTAHGPDFAPPVQFSATSGTFQDELILTLTTTNRSVSIRYTLDGTIPTETSPQYEQPLSLTQTAQVRARAYANGLLPGPVRSETFIPLSAPTAQFTSDLPVMVIHHFNQGRPLANTDTFAHIQLYEPGTNGVTSLTNPPTLTSRAAISARGTTTRGYPKVSLNMEFHDELDFSRNLEVLGMPAESDWVLYAPNNFEPILLHNPFAHQLSRDVGRYSPRTRFVEVYLIGNGFGPVDSLSYHGIYVILEKIKVGSDRVDIPKLRSGQNTLPTVTGGYLMKIDRADPGDAGFVGAGAQIQYVSPKEEEILQPDRGGQRAYLHNYLDNFGNALHSGQFRDPIRGYRAFIDVNSWIDHHLLNVVMFNVDALRLSAFFYKPRDGKLHFGPLWDFDRALYSTDPRDSNPRTWRSAIPDYGTDFFNYGWWYALFRDSDFYQEYIDRYQELRRGAFSTNHLWKLVDDLAGQVRQAQPREQARWGINPRGGYEAEVSILKRWLRDRVEFIDSQFVRPPRFSAPGGVVSAGFTLSLQVPEDTTVYYTLDGTDPRRTGTDTGNDRTGEAIRYTRPIVIQKNSRVIARARNPDHSARTGSSNPPRKSIWSGPISATYVVTPFSLRLTEIMYHPDGDGGSSTFIDEDFEYLELHNFGADPVDLTGFRLEGTVNFEFTEETPVRTLAGGARLLLVGNLEAFGRRYPQAGPVAGRYEGRLDNRDGRLALFGPLREPVFDFHYHQDWSPLTDGNGPSLVLREEAGLELPPSEATSWRASRGPFGSPGEAEPVELRLGLTAVPEGIQIQFTGIPGNAYRLEEYSEDLAAWQLTETRVAAGNGTVQILVAPVTNSRLYRVVAP